MERADIKGVDQQEPDSTLRCGAHRFRILGNANPFQAYENRCPSWHRNHNKALQPGIIKTDPNGGFRLKS